MQKSDISKPQIPVSLPISRNPEPQYMWALTIRMLDGLFDFFGRSVSCMSLCRKCVAGHPCEGLNQEILHSTGLLLFIPKP